MVKKFAMINVDSSIRIIECWNDRKIYLAIHFKKIDEKHQQKIEQKFKYFIHTTNQERDIQHIKWVLHIKISTTCMV